MFFPTLQQILLTVFFLLIGLSVRSQDLTYQPVNPAFGGNTLNYSWMLNSANVQNRIQAPDTREELGRSPLDNFTETLERQLLSQLSREIFDNQFGEGFLSEDGSTQIGNFQVDVETGIDGLLITITDFSTGGTTQLTVPFF